MELFVELIFPVWSVYLMTVKSFYTCMTIYRYATTMTEPTKETKATTTTLVVYQQGDM